MYVCFTLCSINMAGQSFEWSSNCLILLVIEERIRHTITTLQFRSVRAASGCYFHFLWKIVRSIKVEQDLALTTVPQRALSDPSRRAPLKWVLNFSLQALFSPSHVFRGSCLNLCSPKRYPLQSSLPYLATRLLLSDSLPAWLENMPAKLTCSLPMGKEPQRLSQLLDFSFIKSEWWNGENEVQSWKFRDVTGEMQDKGKWDKKTDALWEIKGKRWGN